jgi:hypothetical protein
MKTSLNMCPKMTTLYRSSWLTRPWKQITQKSEIVSLICQVFSFGDLADRSYFLLRNVCNDRVK